MSVNAPFGIPEKDLERVVKLLTETPGILQAKIFGSRAMGTYHDGSDIDIVINAPTVDHDKYLRLCTRLDDLLLPYKIDLLLEHKIDHDALREHIARVGVRVI
jgi:uncharacterized protein